MRQSITVRAWVTRSSLGLPKLDLSTGGYDVVSLTSGGVTWRRTVVQGKYQRGRALVQAQQDTVTDVLVVRVSGTSQTQVENRVAVLRQAFSQFTYTLTTEIDGVVRTIDCEPADMAIVGDDTRQKTLTYHLMREVSLSIPRDPQLMDGAL